ncbi:hypothetical protein CFC21_020244 [Triticum aestivum]|uniref:Uncharacterized protein n=2 Tax=Triticum aestivum TaxID=4565 RepID=A0A9R1E7E3_WHEAT|nr:hypothetical protein CFC21_020244 [Triticum aestivum]
MSASASTSDDGSRLPRSGRAPSTRAGAAEFLGRRPSVPLFHLPSSVAGAARPWACSALRLLVQCRSGIRQDCSFVVVATCHSDFLVILYFTRLGCSSRAHPMQRAGPIWRFHGPPLPTASPFPAAYCKHGE